LSCRTLKYAYQLKIELLKKIDLFQSYDVNTLGQLIDHCEEIILAPNEILFKEDSLETAMYLILLGEVEIYKGPKQMALIEASLNHVKGVKVPYIKTKQDILPIIRETVKGISTHKYMVGKKLIFNPRATTSVQVSTRF